MMLNLHAHQDFLKGLIREAMALADNKELSKKARRHKILQVADRFSDFIKHETPCGTGCSHCCYMAVSVSQEEAELIGEYVERDPFKLNFDPQDYVDRNGGRDLYEGVACTFLVEGRCTVYPVRPIACRLHHSLQSDPSDCAIGSGKEINVLNIYNIHNAFVDATSLFSGGSSMGDIREYFPKPSKDKHDNAA